MKLRTFIAIAALGGFVYLHKRRGGELTFASFRETARDLLGTAKQRAIEVKDRTEREAREVASNFAGAAEQARH